MAIWPFNRKKEQPSADIPQEVQDYYQAEKREKVGIAGLLALGTLLVTIVLAMALFFGGRWVYRTVFEDDDSSQTAQQDQTDDEASEDETEETPGGDVTEPTPAPAPTPAPGPVATNAQPAKGDLPQTGPADTAALFLATIVLATAGYYYLADPQKAKQ